MKNILILISIMLTGVAANAQSDIPSDKNATRETVRLYNNLKRSSKKGYLFGHQDDLAYGVKWKYVEGRSDVKEVTGDYPALYGWELSHLELDEKVNIDTVPFNNIKHYIQAAYARGAVNTISWHGTNPMTGKSAWDPAAGTVASILPGGAKHDLYKSQLDKVAAFLLSLRGKNGELIPVLYRPFHELTGNWFWWGAASCSATEYKDIYRFTVHYLKDVKKVHNLIYVYNTSDNFNNADNFLERYPGDDVVDVLSFDTYASGDPINGATFAKNLDYHLSVIEKLAQDKHKLYAVAEAGYNHVPDNQWWTNVLMKGLSGHQPAYVLLWRNAGFKASDSSVEYYIPYKGHASEADFLKFYEAPQTLFQKEAAAEKLYQ